MPCCYGFYAVYMLFSFPFLVHLLLNQCTAHYNHKRAYVGEQRPSLRGIIKAEKSDADGAKAAECQ